MTSPRVFEHRAAVKRLQALSESRIWADGSKERLAEYIEYHQRAAEAIEALEAAAEESYPGGREVRIDPPYDR